MILRESKYNKKLYKYIILRYLNIFKLCKRQNIQLILSQAPRNS